MLAAPPAENMSQERRGVKILYHTVSAVMLLVGTQPLRSQHPPPQRCRSARAEEKKGKGGVERSSGDEPSWGRGGDFIWIWCCCGGCGGRRTCSGFRLHGGAEKGKTAGSVTLASPPSRHLLTRPHCVLLPLRLSHAGPHQLGTRLLLWPLFHLFI